MSSRDDGSRAAVIAGLLVVSLVTTGVLAWQAESASASHREAAESVLRDYASLAADEYVRRTTAKLGYEGYYPLLTSLHRRIAATGDLDEAIQGLEENVDERLARGYFTFRRASNELAVSGTAGTDELRGWLRRELAKTRTESRPYFVVHEIVSGDPVTAVFGESGSDVVAGFLASPGELERYLSASFEEKPVLPPSLGEGGVTNAAIFLSVVDHDGIERFRTSGSYNPGLGAEAPFGDAYGGVLRGSSVRLSLDRAAAAHLLIGGLPPSRAPMLLGLLLLTGGLVATALREIQRERQVQKLRSDFVASVSHELRTPLTHIRMFSETLVLGRVRSEEEAGRSLRIVDREVRRLAHLVENVLQFSRAERGSLVLSPESLELEPRILETLELFHPLAEAKGVRIRTRFQPELVGAFDPDALRQVLLNLLDNAVKYGPRAGEIVVGSESRDGAIRVFVEDEGPGVPPRERERIFDRFYRLERERSSPVAGTGIGLSVVRELVTRQGGRVLVESGTKGGARIVVEIPSSEAEG